MNRIFYPIMLMAYGFFVLGLFARAEAHGMEQERNLLRDVPRVHLAHTSDTQDKTTDIKTTETNTQRTTASTKSSVEGEETK